MSPQADFIVSNGTGAAVRSDLNVQFAAIVSNNSGATEPATMYAYQWWADTTTGLLKLRNSANSAWVSLFELDGTFIASDISLGAGTVGAPSLFFTGDSDTGLFSPGADTLALVTAGTNRLHITSAGLVGIGNTGPDAKLHITGGASFTGGEANLAVTSSTTASVPATISSLNSDATLQIFAGGLGSGGSRGGQIDLKGGAAATDAGTILFRTGTGTGGTSQTEKARLDASGRLLVGISTAVTAASKNSHFQVVGTGQESSSAQLTRLSSDNNAPSLVFGKANGAAVTNIVSNGTQLGKIEFAGSDGTDINSVAAKIDCFVDGTPGATDMPGRLVFSTTADGASSPTERMRITERGYTQGVANGAASLNYGHQFGDNSDNTITLSIDQRNAGFAQAGGGMLFINCARAASSAYTFLGAYSGDSADREFNLRGDGTGLCDGSWTGGGADYAEYFEWSDSNLDAEDRRGISVVLDGEKIREAVAGEDPIGVISGNPSVVGDAAWNKWSGKYLRDDFGTYIQEDYEVTNDDGNTVIQQRRKLNPAYDPDVEYVSREQRSEWDCVGLMGKLRIRKGQVTGSRWIKMRDINDSVEEWLVR
jgi:hypothetical protein